MKKKEVEQKIKQILNNGNAVVIEVRKGINQYISTECIWQSININKDQGVFIHNFKGYKEVIRYTISCGPMPFFDKEYEKVQFVNFNNIVTIKEYNPVDPKKITPSDVELK